MCYRTTVTPWVFLLFFYYFHLIIKFRTFVSLFSQAMLRKFFLNFSESQQETSPIILQGNGRLFVFSVYNFCPYKHTADAEIREKSKVKMESLFTSAQA
ncbi:hypothetical protein CN350_22810 [Bacillus cereus]|nr:hypothetical protein CN350_22810 [Bacillus cereus]